jgi:cytochrome P450
MATETLSIIDPEFWQLPLQDRMARFAELREDGPFVKFSVFDPIVEQDLDFYVVTRFAEVMEISRRPQDFCSGKGSTSIGDLPQDAMEFFGSFIVMDDPRHARQRPP